jgi:signal transduction histidine kinase
VTAPASIRSTGTQVPAAVRRLGDVLGLGAAAAWAVVVGVVVVLGALLWSGQLVATVLVLLVLVVALVVVAVRVLQPVRALTRDVDRAADALPAALGPDLDPGAAIEASGPSEVTALAGAVTSLHTAATTLARQEHDRHRRTRDLTAHLARRNHGLVDRLVTQIEELETAERSPIVLGQLSRLKHTAVRTRRHAESMLVMTGTLPDRGRPRPAAMADVLRAALAGIEDHARVDTGGVELAAVSGSAVADLAHLLAELVENGAHFSPPGTRIQISGAPDPDGYRLRVADHGVGMTSDQLDAVHDRLRAPSGAQVDHQPAKLIGLDVVGRLAARHGIAVTLDHGGDDRGDDGLVATVLLPQRLLVALSNLPAPRRPVSALVAAAAFRPPLAGASEPVDAPGAHQPNGPRVDAAAEPELVRPGVPRRIRGAQLPDLGPDRTDGPHVTPDAGRVHGRLNALQAGLSAARTDNIPPLPQSLPRPREAQPREPEPREPVRTVPAPADGDD